MWERERKTASPTNRVWERERQPLAHARGADGSLSRVESLKGSQPSQAGSLCHGRREDGWKPVTGGGPISAVILFPYQGKRIMGNLYKLQRQPGIGCPRPARKPVPRSQ